MSKPKEMQIVKQTFQKINDLVVPTMGAKGRLAIIEQEMDRPLLTDDGVTVARESRSIFKGQEKMVAISAIEAASTTEVEAFDGTTLTILMINELYKQGLRWTLPKYKGGKGLHPQQAADLLQAAVSKTRETLKNFKWPAQLHDVQSVATISTKMPIVGKIVTEAYKQAGSDMNVMVEHDRNIEQHRIEHIDGMSIESGYFAEVMRALCNRGDKTEFTQAKLALFSSDVMTYNDVYDFFNSIPEGEKGRPLVFAITRKFNPESLQLLVTTLKDNNFTFQMIFLNEESDDELFLDLAAKTGGVIQDAVLQSSTYLYHHCGTVDKIVIEQDKTIIIAQGDVSDRVDRYKKELEDDKYMGTRRRQTLIKRRLSALTNGITKIQVAVATITEYNILRLKLEDAIGAVKKSLEEGVVLGGGKALFNLVHGSLLTQDDLKLVSLIKKPLEKPMRQIISNAGLRFPRYLYRNAKDKITVGVDVTTGNIIDLQEAGIIDSFSSIDSALKNAVSIASNYLRGYTTISKN
jgi:chaperonin GroEL